MNLIAFFTENGAPKTGLSPTIDVWKLDGTSYSCGVQNGGAFVCV